MGESVWFIFVEVLLPVFVLIGAGVVLQRKFRLDLYTLSKLNIYYLTPALIFSKLYESEFSLSVFLGVIGFTALFVLLLRLIGYALGRWLNLERRLNTAFSHSILFYNSGNYGIPVNDLVFRHDPFAMSIQIAVMVFQNMFLFSYGVFALDSMETGKLKALFNYFKMPLFYALVLGIGMNVLDADMPSFLLTPITYVSNSLIAIVLLTLGAQIANLKINFMSAPLYLSLFVRLAAGPLIAFLLIRLIGFEGILAQALLISTAMPTSVNSAMIAQEYGNEPEFAAQTVVASTAISSLTLAIVISFALRFF